MLGDTENVAPDIEIENTKTETEAEQNFNPSETPDNQRVIKKPTAKKITGPKTN